MRGVAVVLGVITLAAVASAVYFYTYVKTAAAIPRDADGNPIDVSAGTGDATDTLDNIVSSTVAAIAGWKSVGSASDWLPTLGQAEVDHGLPQDLLARTAFEESSFKESVIRGTKASPAGALGILQMMPEYFDTVDVPVPFTDADVTAQIYQSAQQIQSLYGSFHDWSLTLAAYNAGAGNVHKYGGIPPFPETQKYVAQIIADVPALGVA